MSKHQINHTSTTLWVNASNGSCIGRFDTRWGVDIHNTKIDKDGVQCLYCTHGRAGKAQWLLFVKKMWEHHKVKIKAKLFFNKQQEGEL